jgi:putative endonuclease
LVYYDIFENIEDAIYREKILKKWNRYWKIELIEKENPQREDLYDEI